jgi:hypothetical protein
MAVKELTVSVVAKVVVMGCFRCFGARVGLSYLNQRGTEQIEGYGSPSSIWGKIVEEVEEFYHEKGRTHRSAHTKHPRSQAEDLCH